MTSTGGVTFDDDHSCTPFDELLDLREQWRAARMRVVWTNGCFDIFHAGHTRFLAQARSLGDVLIVGVNSDESVSRLKGDERPFLDFASRVTVLRGMRSVDHVVMLSEDTPCKDIDLLRPDMCCKDESYLHLPLPERQTVEGYGGVMMLLPTYEGMSTSTIAERVRLARANAR